MGKAVATTMRGFGVSPLRTQKNLSKLAHCNPQDHTRHRKQSRAPQQPPQAAAELPIGHRLRTDHIQWTVQGLHTSRV